MSFSVNVGTVDITDFVPDELKLVADAVAQNASCGSLAEAGVKAVKNLLSSYEFTGIVTASVSGHVPNDGSRGKSLNISISEIIS